MKKNNQSTNSIPTDNLILFDWLTFTTRIYDERSVLAMLGLSDQPFQELEKGRFGYRKRLLFENINIYFDGTEQMGICVDMTGTGCRAFETYSTVTWDHLFSEMRSQPDDFKITRLDCAFDDHTGILDMAYFIWVAIVLAGLIIGTVIGCKREKERRQNVERRNDHCSAGKQ